jgi:hypothetical protein
MNISYKFLMMMEGKLSYMRKFQKIWLVKELTSIVKELLLTF